MAKMTVARLMEILETCDPEAEVRLAQQPSWPFEYSVGDVEEIGTDEGPVVYIGEGRQLNYLPGEVREALGWTKER